jgi:hypothetical protein
MQRRQIPQAMVDTILQQPEQIIDVKSGKKAYRSRVDFGGGRIFLVRAIVDDSVDPAVVVTAYRTSQIAIYWRSP